MRNMNLPICHQRLLLLVLPLGNECASPSQLCPFNNFNLCLVDITSTWECKTKNTPPPPKAELWIVWGQCLLSPVALPVYMEFCSGFLLDKKLSIPAPLRWHLNSLLELADDLSCMPGKRMLILDIYPQKWLWRVRAPPGQQGICSCEATPKLWSYCQIGWPFSSCIPASCS